MNPNGSTSPDGDKHPGEIVHNDRIEGRSYTRRADQVPPTIAWVKVAGTWKPVVRIEITGSKERRCFTKFGADGQMLETTVASSPWRPPPSDPDAASE
ncbi:MAG: hypothetical protein U1A78_31030 [Polyangia bacterium]